MEAWELVDVVSVVGWLDALESFPPVREDWIQQFQQCVSSVVTSHPKLKDGVGPDCVAAISPVLVFLVPEVLTIVTVGGMDGA